MSIPQIQKAGEMAGEYELIDLIGERSSTLTWVAKAKNGDEVVLKQLFVGRVKDLKTLELFEREAEVLKRLSHPALPKLLDAFRLETGQGLILNLVSDKMPGESLEAKMRQGWRPQQTQIEDIARQCLSALDYLHRLDPPVLHRDLKPANLLLDEQGKVSLVDFGAARHGLLRSSATVAGTFGYLAPEQFSGQALPQSDLYGLGATLLHLLSGKAPSELPREGLQLCFKDHVQAEAGFGAWLAALVAAEPEQRPASAAEALALLDAPGARLTKPINEPTPWPRIRRLRQGQQMVIEIGGPRLRDIALGWTLWNGPPLLLFAAAMGLGLMTQQWIPAVLVGIVGLFWIMILSAVMLEWAISRRQIWLTPDKMHILTKPVKNISQADLSSVALPQKYEKKPRSPILPAVVPLANVQDLRLQTGVFSSDLSPERMHNPLTRLSTRLPYNSLWLQAEGAVDRYNAPIHSAQALMQLSPMMTLEQTLWLQREILEFLLRHQPESAAGNTLLQLRAHQRLVEETQS